ncbi:MAG: hypothetical protein R3249_05360 [Nitriliruptorales bacterium]|nr:hypothetical protein [Nitriliruptorales bacterium]
MSSAGYSGTPLARKLGIQPGQRVLLEGAPDHFEDLVAPLPDGIELLQRAVAPLDLVVTFATSMARLERGVDELEARLATDGAIWTAWPKQSSGVATDITENRLARSSCRPGSSSTSRWAPSTRPGRD